MPKLINKEFSQAGNEWRWHYWLKTIFNQQLINKITITGYYQSKHKGVITNELILAIFTTELDGEILEPIKNYRGKRRPYKWEGYHDEQRYRLIFWFKDNETSHLWVRNCYPID